MPNNLYDSDILIWSEQQASLLARLANGERVNAAIDWPHVIEEVHDLGISELRACESLLYRALVHLLKIRTGVEEPAMHWRLEIDGFLAGASRQFSPSMRQRLDLPRLYRRAQHQFRIGSPSTVQTPSECPFTLDDLLSDAPDLDALLARLDGR